MKVCCSVSTEPNSRWWLLPWGTGRDTHLVPDVHRFICEFSRLHISAELPSQRGKMGCFGKDKRRDVVAMVTHPAHATPVFAISPARSSPRAATRTKAILFLSGNVAAVIREVWTCFSVLSPHIAHIWCFIWSSCVHVCLCASYVQKKKLTLTVCKQRLVGALAVKQPGKHHLLWSAVWSIAYQEMDQGTSGAPYIISYI